jgi:hypothetical protein
VGVVDSSHIRALQGGLTGPSPVDRSRVGFKHHLLVDAAGDDNRPPAVNLFGAIIGTESYTTKLLDELVTGVGADPTSAFRKHMSYWETKRYLAELGDAIAGDDDRLGEASRGEPSAQGHPYSKSECRASWTSRPGAALTTACRRRPPPSSIATSSSCSSTR